MGGGGGGGGKGSDQVHYTLEVVGGEVWQTFPKKFVSLSAPSLNSRKLLETLHTPQTLLLVCFLSVMAPYVREFLSPLSAQDEESKMAFQEQPLCSYCGHQADILDVSWSKVRWQ